MKRTTTLLFAVLALVNLLWASTWLSAQAQSPLPPRPTLTPTPTHTAVPTYTPVPTYTAVPTYTPVPTHTPIPIPTATPVPLRMQGGGIVLDAPAYPSSWVVVQWLDGDGIWQDIEGWRGWSNNKGLERWWVHPRNLGQTNFRWQIYSAPDGDLLAVSDSFDLPALAQDLVTVSVP